MEHSYVFTFPVRVYYEDTDAGGIVYYANYLKFAERARTEFLRQRGIHQSTLLEEHDTAFVVRTLHATYHAAAKLDDVLDVHVTLGACTATRIRMTQEIRLGTKPCCTLAVELVCVSKALKPKKIPAGLFEESKGE